VSKKEPGYRISKYAGVATLMLGKTDFKSKLVRRAKISLNIGKRTIPQVM
jgi:hypothetical protein